MRVESSSRDTATVSFAPPTGSSNTRVEYSKGKFPTQGEVKTSGSGRASYVMTGLDSGKKYSLRVKPLCPDSDRVNVGCAIFDGEDCRLEVTTQVSRGHDCQLHDDVDYCGHDMVFGHGGAVAARRQGVGGAEACCAACVAVEASRPYNDICSHFVYEKDTGTCYFKSPDGEGGLGREERKGFVAGRVMRK
uniref:Apple domain-containing protein n=1 Tax=Mantoniella antarctica TaxID=81844 RepID=A0A7S0XDC0_9CHLO|mmetsp:Transcript_35649/g.89057  ORF Transcript_35649/g.89057 Transcript_35649/m.89057 type:complete len:191 (+) Transcript_35649:439-1011(+)